MFGHAIIGTNQLLWNVPRERSRKKERGRPPRRSFQGTRPVLERKQTDYGEFCRLKKRGQRYRGLPQREWDHVECVRRAFRPQFEHEKSRLTGFLDVVNRCDVGMIERCRTSASRWKRFTREGPRENSSGRNLIATSRLSLVSRARYTSPYSCAAWQ
jgi:hypothetical protein